MAAPAASQTRHAGVFEVRSAAGLSEYLGDNNTKVLNPSAFGVPGKAPFSVSFEAGYHFTSRFSIYLGVREADYPIVTRFYKGLDVRDHTTRRHSFSVLARRMRPGRVRLYASFGYHLSFGSVQIFEATRLELGTPLNTQNHYIHGPVVGIGLDIPLGSRMSVFADLTGLVTRMDDSVDGRLPLGPPQPTNLRERNRFGTFDLLNAYSLGIAWRSACRSSCVAEPTKRHRTALLSVTSQARADVASVSYLIALSSSERLFIGPQIGLVPRAIHVRYTYPDGQESLDQTRFSGSFVGIAARINAFGPKAPVQPYGSITAAFPRQAHLAAGIEAAIGPAIRVGAQVRFIACPRRRQDINNPLEGFGILRYRMNRTCTSRGGFAISAGYRLPAGKRHSR